jgi:hypothetical protein
MYLNEVAEFFSDMAHNCISLPDAAELNGLSLPLQNQYTSQVSRYSLHVYRPSKSFIVDLLQYHVNYARASILGGIKQKSSLPI